jgi:UDP-N-acetylglucosamine/UDP-N-acetylgalactosamine diphosphorylase
MKETVEKLEKYGQEHLLRFYDELDENQKKHLIDQINSIDFELVKTLYNNIGENKEINDEITPMKSFETDEEYFEIGLESVKNNEYALVTMAGGQGTRLGFKGPKGAFVLEDGINKSLFEIQCDKLKNIYSMANVYILWIIMTSYDNCEETLKFFEDNKYFGYPIDKIKFFNQGELPSLDTNGKIIMDSKYNIKFAPDGHGGVFNALHKKGLTEYLKNQNVKWIFIGGIDNALLPVDKLDLVGFAIKNNFVAASKIISKAYPEEKVGVFCYRNGKPSVIEYIEMTPEMNNLKDENGNYFYNDAHIICNLFNIKVLEAVADKELNYHTAFKKSDYMNENGELVTPEKENIYKFEAFCFDAFSYFNEVGLLKGKREEIFAPLKNATGVDSIETATKLYKDYYLEEK